MKPLGSFRTASFVLLALLSVPGAFGQEGGHAAPPAGHGPAASAESHAAEGNPNEIWWKWANFVILAAGLGWLISKHAGPYFRSRAAAIQGGIADAGQVRKEAEARAAEIERKVGDLSAEVQRMREQSQGEIAREGQRVSAETAAQIAKIQAQAEAEIASAAKHAAQDLRAYSAQLAVEMAERQIRERVTGQVQDGLTDAFVKELNKTVVN